MSATLLDKGAAISSDTKNRDALNKVAVFYVSCYKHFVPPSEQSGLHQDVTNILTILKEIEDIEVGLFLDPTSPDEARYLEKLYRELPMPSRSGYYVNRLLPIAVALDGSPLLERHSRCLDDDVLSTAVAAYSQRDLCVSPALVSQPLFYAGAEAFVNYPTMGFLLAEPYADVIFRTLRKAPPGTDTSRRFTATMSCLRRQLESLGNTTVSGDARPAALFRLAGALQLAHDAVENSGGFSGGDSERRAFFERQCWLWCSRMLHSARSLSAVQLDAKGVCNIVVRNVLAFYRWLPMLPGRLHGQRRGLRRLWSTTSQGVTPLAGDLPRSLMSVYIIMRLHIRIRNDYRSPYAMRTSLQRLREKTINVL
nr:uncharacterized protein LOC119169093 isoform X2 [Rhipicephalus microplus]